MLLITTNENASTNKFSGDVLSAAIKLTDKQPPDVKLLL